MHDLQRYPHELPPATKISPSQHLIFPFSTLPRERDRREEREREKKRMRGRNTNLIFFLLGLLLYIIELGPLFTSPKIQEKYLIFIK